MTSLDRPVAELMQREMVTLQQGDRLDLADDIMNLGRIRHIPVVEGEQLVGVLSHRDLLSASLSTVFDFEGANRRAFNRAVDVKEVMTRTIETIGPDESVAAAGRRMLERRIGCLPVVDGAGTLLGLITETDIMRAALGIDADEEVGEPAATGASHFEEELEQLRRARDELRLQVHLGKAEAAELWEKLEQRLAEAESRVRTLAGLAEEPVHDVAEAARLLIDEIRSGYKKLRQLH